MQLSDIENNARDQERGVWCELADPWTGKPTGIRLRMAGPDSQTAARAALTLADELAAALDETGRIPAAEREAARLRALAAHVLDWEAAEDDKPVPFAFANVLRLLRAAKWVQAQVDGWAADRRLHAPGRGV